MTDSASYPDPKGDTGDDTGVGLRGGSPPSTPRWVKVFGIIALVVILLFVILHLSGRGISGHTPSPSAAEHGAQQL